MKNTNAYHSWLSRPLPPPEDPSAPTLSLPELWGRVRGFFARVLEHVGGARRLREQGLFGAEDRFEIESRLKPVERLARIVLAAQAVVRLLMTPEGRKLLRETPKAMPERRKPAPGEIAVAASPPPASPQPSHEPGSESPERRYGFRVLKWTFSDEPTPHPPLTLAPGPYVESAEENEDALQLHPSLARRMLKPPSRSALALARRIEALSRVIDNPEPAIRRVARFFARLPHGLIEPVTFGLAVTGNWFHCGPEYRRALAHSERALTVFNILIEPG